MSSWSQTFTCCQWRLGSSRSAVYSPCVTDVWRAGYRKSSWTFVYLLFIFLQAAVTGGLCFQSSVHQSQYHERSVSRTPTCITSCCSSSCCENSSDPLSLQDLWTCAEVSGTTTAAVAPLGPDVNSQDTICSYSSAMGLRSLGDKSTSWTIHPQLVKCYSQEHKTILARTGIEPATLALLAPRSNQLS